MKNPNPKLKFFALLLFVPIMLFSQPKPTESGVILDNDLFTSSVNDKYYTNGIEFFYRFLNRKSSETIRKTITEFRIGQYIYNPHLVRANNIADNDRPYCGYLFGRVGYHTYFESETVLKLNFQAGYVGPNAFGQETQEFFHRAVGYLPVYGWQHQIKNALALQLNGYYSKKLHAYSDNADLHAVAEVNAGTVNAGISFGLLSRISLKKLLPVYDSNLYNASLNADPKLRKEQSEFYFYANPNLNYQLYDATIQGSLFHDNSPVTYSLMPFRFNGEAGFKYRKNNWNLSYIFVYRSKEAKNPIIEGYFYGSIGVGYAIH